MGRARRAALWSSLVCLPLLLAAMPAVAGRLTDALQLRPHASSAGAAHGAQLHRGVKVRVTGTAQGQLRPGTSVPVALRFQNPNSHRVRMSKVRVKIAAILAPRADAAHPCTTADFAVRQMARRTLRVPANRTTDLAGLGVPVAEWPQLAMLNRPLNQDGCKGTTLTLRFKARGLKR